MNEVRALVEAFDTAIASGERCALATIVSVEGSSYRGPGARMLIREAGSTTGTISAGCLENDVVEHAKRVIETGEAKLVQYENGSTTDEIAWGLGLGCNGIVRVLIEPLASDSLYIAALRDSYERHLEAPAISVATVYHYTPSSPDHKNIETGARLFIGEQGDISAEKLNGSAAAMFESVRANVNGADAPGDYSLEINGSLARVFVEKLLPPVPLIIFGAGHDALPIVELARRMGWNVEVVDTQQREASRERFGIADRVSLVSPEDVSRHVTITERTLALVMSHNFGHDRDIFKFLLGSDARYIGVMGPRKRTERMLAELSASDEEFRLDGNDLERIYSPVGLDIGANGPAEIALSIVAEMRAVMEGRRGGMLRESRNPIHNSPKVTEIERVDESRASSVGAIILAAGSSTRMGRPKQSLQFDGKSLLRRAALAAIEAGCSPVIVVTGANAEVSRRELAGLDVLEVWNPKWETGMGSSIGAGVRGLLDADPQAAAATVMLCDQPYVTADVISRLISAHRLNRNTIIGSRYEKGFGVPALFTRPLFDELAQLEGAAGAKAVITKHGSHAHFIAFPEGDIDVDTPDDYERLITEDLKLESSGAVVDLGR